MVSILRIDRTILFLFHSFKSPAMTTLKQQRVVQLYVPMIYTRQVVDISPLRYCARAFDGCIHLLSYSTNVGV